MAQNLENALAMRTILTRDFLGVPIDLISSGEALQQIIEWRQTQHRGYVTLVNPYSAIACGRDWDLRAAIIASDLAVPDGVGITVAARLLGYGRADRVGGPTFMLNVCDSGRAHQLRHFLYGGRQGVATTLARRLEQRFPGITICGVFCPPFSDATQEEDVEIVERINAASPDVVWVALGTGKQEKWMASHVSRLRAAALVGVGAAFDFHAGTVPWAPPWVRRAGLEWVYRLVHEPGRMWRRDLDSIAFLARIVAQRTSHLVARAIAFPNSSR